MTQTKINRRLALLTASLYLAPAALALAVKGSPWFLLLVPVGWAITCVLAALNLAAALRLLAAGPPAPAVLHAALWSKLAALPCVLFYVLLALAAQGLNLGMLNPWLFWFIPLSFALTLALGGLLLGAAFVGLLGSSVYGLAHLVRLARQKILAPGQCALAAVLQLLFGLDIVGTAWLLKLSRGQSQL